MSKRAIINISIMLRASLLELVTIHEKTGTQTHFDRTMMEPNTHHRAIRSLTKRLKQSLNGVVGCLTSVERRHQHEHITVLDKQT